MVELSVLVNRYQMLEALELHVGLWLPALKEKKSTTVITDLPRWLSIAWVFQLPQESKEVARIALHESRQTPDTWPFAQGLPIPNCVLGRHPDPLRRVSILVRH